jgi:hypothetical protein
MPHCLADAMRANAFLGRNTQKPFVQMAKKRWSLDAPHRTGTSARPWMEWMEASLEH